MKAFVSIDKLDLTDSEINIIDKYTGGESLWINNFLRDRNLDQLNEKQKLQMKQYAIHLNNIINKSPLSKKTTTVYRGAEPINEKWLNLKRGEELLFTQKGLISTTFDKSVAIDFIESDQDCCLLVLRLPKGTKGLYISGNSMFNELNEDELLLPHGSKFIIDNKKTNIFNGKKIITYYAKLISQR
jgi:hypothetical protein